MKKLILNSLGFIFLFLGIIGSVLPILPTTPFLLLSAYFFSRGSERLYNWLIGLPKIGKSIKDWNEYGLISTKSKIICVFSLMLASLYVVFYTGHSNILKTLIIGILLMVGAYVISRPHQLVDKRSNLI